MHPARPRSPRGFLAVRDRVWGCLPGRLRALVPVTFVGFCLLNLFTFSVDLSLLSLLYAVIGLPNPVAVSIAYGVAFALAFLLNRRYNFQSHSPAGPQTARYVLVVAINYGAIILGLGSGLSYVGVPFQLARILAGVVEALFMYSAMRWFVFAAPAATPETESERSRQRA